VAVKGVGGRFVDFLPMHRQARFSGADDHCFCCLAGFFSDLRAGRISVAKLQ
jgi:hypothetical protein